MDSSKDLYSSLMLKVIWHLYLDVLANDIFHKIKAHKIKTLDLEARIKLLEKQKRKSISTLKSKIISI